MKRQFVTLMLVFAAFVAVGVTFDQLKEIQEWLPASGISQHEGEVI